MISFHFFGKWVIIWNECWNENQNFPHTISKSKKNVFFWKSIIFFNNDNSSCNSRIFFLLNHNFSLLFCFYPCSNVLNVCVVFDCSKKKQQYVKYWWNVDDDNNQAMRKKTDRKAKSSSSSSLLRDQYTQNWLSRFMFFFSFFLIWLWLMMTR